MLFQMFKDKASLIKPNLTRLEGTLPGGLVFATELCHIEAFLIRLIVSVYVSRADASCEAPRIISWALSNSLPNRQTVCIGNTAMPNSLQMACNTITRLPTILRENCPQFYICITTCDVHMTAMLEYSKWRITWISHLEATQQQEVCLSVTKPVDSCQEKKPYAKSATLDWHQFVISSETASLNAPLIDDNCLVVHLFIRIVDPELKVSDSQLLTVLVVLMPFFRDDRWWGNND